MGMKSHFAGMHFSKQVAYSTLLPHHAPIQRLLTYGVWMFLFKSHKVFISFAYWQNSKKHCVEQFCYKKTAVCQNDRIRHPSIEKNPQCYEALGCNRESSLCGYGEISLFSLKRQHLYKLYSITGIRKLLEKGVENDVERLSGVFPFISSDNTKQADTQGNRKAVNLLTTKGIFFIQCTINKLWNLQSWDVIKAKSLSRFKMRFLYMHTMGNLAAAHKGRLLWKFPTRPRS